MALKINGTIYGWLLAPGDPYPYISKAQPSWGLFDYWQDWGTHISLFSQKRITDLVPDFNSELA